MLRTTFEIVRSFSTPTHLKGCMLLLGLFLGGLCMAQNTYSNATIKGTYAMAMVPYGGVLPVAGTGIMSFDGAGKITGGRFIANLPGDSFDKRKLVVQTVTGGTYSVDQYGLGTLSVEGLSVSAWRLLIHEMEPSNNTGATRLASSLRMISEVVDPNGGNLLTLELHRRPDNAVFATDRIGGFYVRKFVGWGGFANLAALGKVEISDGFIDSQGDTILNLPGTEIGAREVTGIPASGTIELDADGMGVLGVIEGGIGGGHVVALKSIRTSDGELLTLEAFVVFDDYFTLGNLITGRATLQFLPE